MNKKATFMRSFSIGLRLVQYWNDRNLWKYIYETQRKTMVSRIESWTIYSIACIWKDVCRFIQADDFVLFFVRLFSFSFGLGRQEDSPLDFSIFHRFLPKFPKKLFLKKLDQIRVNFWIIKNHLLRLCTFDMRTNTIEISLILFSVKESN